jgi:cytochrome c oxidase accessory protein FixG
MATKKRRLDLPEDRLASIDEQGHHVALNPASVRGRWRSRRDWFYVGLIIVFLVLPWTKFAGHQTILLDIPNRRFAFFGLTFWAHDVPLMFFVFGILTVGLTFVTLVAGRVWCGWACPQTVFIDRIYRRIEEWIEGGHVQRMHLNSAPMSWKKFRKKALKWFLFWFVSTNIAHSFTAYFVGAERLLDMSLAAPWENLTPFLFVTILTGILLFDFGWFREQFCIIMCPYGRFQSVIMDRDSLAVLYDEGRGEPRKGIEPAGQAHGDCVNCYKCVAVCPTGIDIRRGVQMECIACTACIDACDEIMRNVGTPEGLIRYSTENAIAGGRRRLRRPGVLVYGIVLVAMFVGLGVSVARRDPLDVKLIRAIETPYTTNTRDDGSLEVVNHYRMHIKNQGFDTLTVAIETRGENAGRMALVAPTLPLDLPGGGSEIVHIFFRFPAGLTAGSGRTSVDLAIELSSVRGEETQIERVPLVGPFSVRRAEADDDGHADEPRDDATEIEHDE